MSLITTDQLTEIMIKDIDRLLNDLEIEMTESGDRLYCACPLHGGDNESAFSIYLDRDRFYCYTNECHSATFNSLIGFVRLMLSVKYCDWTTPGDDLYGYAKTLNYIKGLYGIDGDVTGVKPGKHSSSKANKKTVIKPRVLGDRDKYLQYNSGEPEYFLKRGFSAEVLKKYDVRYCSMSNNANYRRCVVPQFDENNRFIIGISGRSTCDEDPKWKYSYKFPCGTTLYNYNFARDYITRNRSVILVEGPADIWRLEESGIHNVVAIWSAMGWNDCKKMLLDKLGIVKIILALDNDDAGRAGREKIKRACASFYNMIDAVIPPKAKDIADLTIGEVKEIFR